MGAVDVKYGQNGINSQFDVYHNIQGPYYDET